MRFFKKINAALALALALTLVTPVAAPVSTVAVAEAATIKLNKTKKTLKVGQTYTLKVSGTSKKVTWKSSKKSVATVSSKGKVKAKAVGKATISAKVAGKTLKCTITVKAADNPALATAPFTASELTTEGFSFVVPKDWVSTTSSENGIYMYVSKPSQEHISSITIALQQADGLSELGYPMIKGLLAEQYSEANLTAAATQSYAGATVSNYRTADVETPLGTAFYLYYEVTVTTEGVSMTMIESDYIVCVDNYMIVIQGIDVPLEGVQAPTTVEIADYIVQSLMKK